MELKISVIRADELDSTARARWQQLQNGNPALASPYFSPEFTLAVGESCDDVRIAVLERFQQVVGFFPFQSHGLRGAPIGRLLSDHHGVVCAPGLRFDWPTLLRAAGLVCWRFDHLCAEQATALAHRAATSPGINLLQGYEAYQRGRLEAHPKYMAEYHRKARKLERDQGQLRFEAHIDDRSVFDAVMRLKSDQYRRTGAAFDVLSLPWTRRLLERLWQTDLPGFGGRLSALYAGDTLVAAHLGMRSQRVWHWWFPVYEPRYAKYSPGVQLLMRSAQTAATQGHHSFDLGKGWERYKALFADQSWPLAEGVVTRWESANAVLDVKQRAGRWLRDTSLARHLRPSGQQMRAQNDPAA